MGFKVQVKKSIVVFDENGEYLAFRRVSSGHFEVFGVARNGRVVEIGPAVVSEEKAFRIALKGRRGGLRVMVDGWSL